MKTDIEIAESIKLEPIKEVAKSLGLKESDLNLYGNYKAKLEDNILEENKNSKDGHLILVTSTNPTPYGEGKTTMTIGLHDALCSLGYKSLATLREPSLGPVFGIKGGATGGGYAQVIPMEDINLHFTGDLHAITSCNNLLCALIDNHLFQGNKLNIDKNQIMVKRCLDMNDRSLREIEIGIGDKNGVPRNDGFQITVASEVMAILCLSRSLKELKERLSHILFAYTNDNKPLYVSDLGCEGALTVLLKDAIKPNLVQTLEHHPVMIHGGPFANIAHGCNSLIATRLALKLADYVVTEAGFGSDLGAEKFLDIKCRIGDLKPNVIVINATIRSLKYNGGCQKDQLTVSSLEYLQRGIVNLKAHILNMKLYGPHVIVCLNQFATDTEEEIAFISKFCEDMDVPFAVSRAHAEGSEGSIDLARKVVELCDMNSDFHFLYEDEATLQEKISIVSRNIYGAEGVDYNDGVLAKLHEFEKMGYGKYPICIAKTQYSLSDDSKKLGKPENFRVTVSDVKLCSGAGFVVIYMGNIMTMPGLSKCPAAFNMNITDEGNITGLF